MLENVLESYDDDDDEMCVDVTSQSGHHISVWILDDKRPKSGKIRDHSTTFNVHALSQNGTKGNTFIFAHN